MCARARAHFFRVGVDICVYAYFCLFDGFDRISERTSESVTMQTLINVTGAGRRSLHWKRILLLLLRSILHAKINVAFHGEVGSPPQGLRLTPQLLAQVRRLRPGLTSLFCKGGARLKDVIRGLDAGATRALICAGNLDPVETGQEQNSESELSVT